MIEVGTVLQNRYRIENHIGQGGMGKVYVAIDERFNSTVAIKETIFEDKNLRKAFEREARLLNSLKHPALPRVSDHFIEGDGQFLVMEYIAGDDLAEKMERSGVAFPARDVLNWANQLCDALDYLHSQNIIHRDIKPQNLKLSSNNQIILLDFGLAKGNPTDAHSQTAAKSIFGYSRSYASLEQIQGTGTEPRSDLYSLAATLYHLLTGVPPADALTRAMNVLNGQPDPLIAANLLYKNVPVELAAILSKTMALNAGERPETAAELRSMLGDFGNYFDSGSSKPISAKSFAPDLFSQKTQLFAQARTLNPTQSQLETRISTENVVGEKTFKTSIGGTNEESKVTLVNNSPVDTKIPKSRRKIAAAFLGGLLLVGSGFSAMFLINPDVSQENINTAAFKDENSNSSNSASSVAEDSPEIEVTDEETSDEVTEAKPTAKTNNTKSNQVTKNYPKQTKNQTSAVNSAEKSKKPDNESGNIVINDDKIEMGDFIIEENGFRIKNSKKKTLTPPIPFEAMSPEQLRRLEQLRNRKNRVIVVKPPPPPKPTP